MRKDELLALRNRNVTIHESWTVPELNSCHLGGTMQDGKGFEADRDSRPVQDVLGSVERGVQEVEHRDCRPRSLSAGSRVGSMQRLPAGTCNMGCGGSREAPRKGRGEDVDKHFFLVDDGGVSGSSGGAAVFGFVAYDQASDESAGDGSFKVIIKNAAAVEETAEDSPKKRARLGRQRRKWDRLSLQQKEADHFQPASQAR
eukprot:s3940_g6.t1